MKVFETIKKKYREPSFKNALLYKIELFRAKMLGYSLYALDVGEGGDKSVVTKFCTYKGKIYILSQREL